MTSLKDVVGSRPPFRALACDYDGTLAEHDRISTSTLRALERAQRAGLRLVLVTGRTLFELTRVCERLNLFDAVVAENGAVLYFPADSALREQGPPPPPRLLAALDRRGVPYQLGHVIVATTHDHRHAVLEALAEAEAPLDLLANRAALMLLPAGISKGTGVTGALFALGITPRDVLAFGDAENDLPLFDACGWSACPDNALPEAKARVDWILPGADGDGVGRAIEERILNDRLPPPRSGRHRLLLGWAVGTSEVVEIPARGVNVLIQGDSLCGKSSFVGGLVERLAATRDSVCIVDPEGDYEVLDSLSTAGRVSVGATGDWDVVVDALGRMTPVIADLTGAAREAGTAFAEAGLRRLQTLREREGIPHWTVVDEAHSMLPEAGDVVDAIARGPKGLCLATYRASMLPPAIIETIDVFIVGRSTQPDEVAFLAHVVESRGLPASVARQAVADLPPGTFLILRAGIAPTTFVPPPRLVPHVRHLTKYADGWVAPHHRFVFLIGRGSGTLTSAGNLAEFVRALGEVPQASLAHHAGRGDFSRWIRDVFRDRVLARRVGRLERRWCRGELQDLSAAVGALVDAARGPVGTPPAGTAGKE